jgi:hypothetical protein
MKRRRDAQGAIQWLRSNRAAQALLVIALVFLFLQVQKMKDINGFFWFQRPQSDEMFLTEYPKLVHADFAQFSVYSSSARECSLCGNPVSLAAGSSEVSFAPGECPGSVAALECPGRSLSFSFLESGEGLPPESAVAVVTHTLENRTLFISASGTGSARGFHPITIEIDGEEAASPLAMLNGSFSFTESVPAPDGSHSYSVSYLGSVLGAGSFTQESAFSPGALEALFLCAVIAWKAPGFARWLRFPLFIPLSALSLIIQFRLEALGAGFVLPVLLSLAAAWLFMRGAESEGANGEARDAEGAGGSRLAGEAAAFGLAFVAFILLANMLIYTFDIWGAYYFRHAGEAFARGTTAYFDSLSYLGRPFTYPPAFFEFSAELARAFGFLGTGYEGLRVPIGLAISFAYAATAYLAFSRLPFAQRLVAASALVTLWGTLMTAAGISIQLFAFTLASCAVIFMWRKPALSAISLGIAFAGHPLALVVFPFLAWSANGFRTDAKFVFRGFLLCLAAVIVSLPFYVPIFLRAGLPYEIVPSQWGYLLTYGFEGIRFSLNFLLPLALAASACALWKRTLAIPALATLSLVLLSAFLSGRLDIAFACVAAGFIPLAFAKELSDARFAALVMLAFILPNLALGAIVMNGTSYYCAWGLANDVCVSPMRYLADYSPSQSAVALNPLYGHLEAYVGRRAVLADLYVEYADEAKFAAENGFYETRNASMLAPYNITYAVLDDFPLPRNLPGEDRVYDNGFMHAFRR